MPNNSVSSDRLPEPAIAAPVHSDHLEPAIQDTLSTLASGEARYQHEREQLYQVPLIRTGEPSPAVRWT